jgi:hypothetical protein
VFQIFHDSLMLDSLFDLPLRLNIERIGVESFDVALPA